MIEGCAAHSLAPQMICPCKGYIWNQGCTPALVGSCRILRMRSDAGAQTHPATSTYGTRTWSLFSPRRAPTKACTSRILKRRTYEHVPSKRCHHPLSIGPAAFSAAPEYEYHFGYKNLYSCLQRHEEVESKAGLLQIPHSTPHPPSPAYDGISQYDKQERSCQNRESKTWMGQ